MEGHSPSLNRTLIAAAETRRVLRFSYQAGLRGSRQRPARRDGDLRAIVETVVVKAKGGDVAALRSPAAPMPWVGKRSENQSARYLR